MTVTRVVPLLLVALAGCSSQGPRTVEAPPALTGALLAEVSGAQLLRLPHDAEAPILRDDANASLHRGDAEAPFARDRQRRPPVSPRTPPASSFDRPLPGALQRAPTDADVSRLLAEALPLRAPARLACVEVRGRREFVNASVIGDPRVSHMESAWAVRPALPATLSAIRGALAPVRGDERSWPEARGLRDGVFSSITTIPSLFLPQPGDLGRVRYAAARVGCEVLLVYARSTRVYSFRNGWANLYPTLIGLLLPGEEQIVVSRVEGALVDVRSGHVFGVAQGEARLAESSSLLLETSDRACERIEQAEADAALHMTRDLVRELSSLQAQGRIESRTEGASK